MDCIFCKIVNGEIKSRLIMESKNSIAFLDAFPVTKGHTLVIPKTHYGKIQDMTQDDSADLFRVVYEVVPKIDKITGSTLLAIHNGKESGQEIPHVHVHLIPRQSSDHAGPVHRMFDSGPNLSDEELDELCNEIKNL